MLELPVSAPGVAVAEAIAASKRSGCSSGTPTQGGSPWRRCDAHTMTAGSSSPAAISAGAWSVTPRRSSSRWRPPSTPPARSRVQRARYSSGRPGSRSTSTAPVAIEPRSARWSAASWAAFHAARARARCDRHRRSGDAVRQPRGGAGARAQPDRGPRRAAGAPVPPIRASVRRPPRADHQPAEPGRPRRAQRDRLGRPPHDHARPHPAADLDPGRAPRSAARSAPRSGRRARSPSPRSSPARGTICTRSIAP